MCWGYSDLSCICVFDSVKPVRVTCHVYVCLKCVGGEFRPVMYMCVWGYSFVTCHVYVCLMCHVYVWVE